MSYVHPDAYAFLDSSSSTPPLDTRNLEENRAAQLKGMTVGDKAGFNTTIQDTQARVSASVGRAQRVRYLLHQHVYSCIDSQNC